MNWDAELRPTTVWRSPARFWNLFTIIRDCNPGRFSPLIITNLPNWKICCRKSRIYILRLKITAANCVLNMNWRKARRKKATAFSPPKLPVCPRRSFDAPKNCFYNTRPNLKPARIKIHLKCSEVEKNLSEIDSDSLSPVEALMKIYELQNLVTDKSSRRQRKATG